MNASDDFPHWKLRDCLQRDLYAIRPHAQGLFGLLAAFMGRGAFFAVVLLRLSQWLCHSRSPLGRLLGHSLGRIIGRINFFLHGCEIDPDAMIDYAFTMPHPSGIVIGKARIGKNVQILQNSTIGLRHPRTDVDAAESYPCLGDNVLVSAGAVVVGANLHRQWGNNRCECGCAF